MALRPDRNVIESDGYSFTLSDVAEAGVGLCYGTAGSGAVMGETHGVVNLKADPSGAKFAGILLQDFVSLNTSLYNKNWFKEEMVATNADVPEIMRKGWVYTNKVTGTPTVGNKAYLTANGVFTPTVSATGGTEATPLVGEFGGKKDEDGFVKIIIDLPMFQ